MTLLQKKERNLRNWFENTLNRISGTHATLKHRQKVKSPPNCPVCQKTIPTCPHCNADMRGTQEKGIDTAMVTDMIKLAWANAYDVAVVVSSDRDFIPSIPRNQGDSWLFSAYGNRPFAKVLGQL
ncbi:MAG: NYN domain-containing protein [Candidatus Dadabacteria bacterium]|nr:NYN domain-containing protein [Candidatus Dadabacteria bacterium]